MGESIPVDMVTTLDVGPGGLDCYLERVGDRAGPLIKYRRGSLTLVSRSYRHERIAVCLDGLVVGICCELDIDYKATGSTLYRRLDLDSGIVADETYYIANELSVRKLMEENDRTVLPPPDLAIEVVFTHSPAKSLAIYRELGVPEVWLYQATRELEILHLAEEGRYSPRPVSRAFPFLTPDDALPWVESSEDEPDNRWERRLRAWVRDELAPRRHA